jgi:hypothetical protein
VKPGIRGGLGRSVERVPGPEDHADGRIKILVYSDNARTREKIRSAPVGHGPNSIVSQCV